MDRYGLFFIGILQYREPIVAIDIGNACRQLYSCFCILHCDDSPYSRLPVMTPDHSFHRKYRISFCWLCRDCGGRRSVVLGAGCFLQAEQHTRSEQQSLPEPGRRHFRKGDHTIQLIFPEPPAAHAMLLYMGQ